MPSSTIWIMLIEVVIYAAAAARISVLVVRDTILDRPREWFFLRYPPIDNPMLGYRYQTLDREGRVLPAGAPREASMLGELFTCTRCVTVWATGIIYLASLALGSSATLMGTAPIASMWVAAFLARRI
jgi:hypothetical protein